MHNNPGATLLKVLLVATIMFFVAFNAWAIHRLETRSGQSDSVGNIGSGRSGGGASSSPASAHHDRNAPVVQQLADGTVIARGVIILPSGVVIVPEGQAAKVFSADGKLVADTGTAGSTSGTAGAGDDNANSGDAGSGNSND